jgi:DNA-3-methyladenine glycosylase
MARGVIVEVEAYLDRDDEASHSFGGRKVKNRSMFMKPGTLYVYPIHAKYCMNIVTEPEGQGAAVLIRAVEPIEGFALMQARRGDRVLERDLTRGPARLCQAFAIDRQMDGVDLLTSSDVWLEVEPRGLEVLPLQIIASPRIGISRSQDRLLRFFVDGNRYVSGCARCHSRPNRESFCGPESS